MLKRKTQVTYAKMGYSTGRPYIVVHLDPRIFRLGDEMKITVKKVKEK